MFLNIEGNLVDVISMLRSGDNDTFGSRRILFGILAWLLFLAVVVRWAFVRNDSSTLVLELAIPVTMLFVVVVATETWIRHNIGIYKRKGPRRKTAVFEAPWTNDSLGRTLDIEVPQLHGASVVVVSVDSHGKKIYRSRQ